jgi:filamentous hemagglutinin family protein
MGDGVSGRRCGWLRTLAGAGLGLLLPGIAAAQHITVDGSLSPARTLAGPNYAIPASLGQQVGGNLFQSFGIFGLSQGESAKFSGPSSVTNIIGRVTGGQSSTIDGTIASSIQGANLYLINPSGIVFGPNATVNVSGAFHASTADYLRMTDGAKFQATNPGGSTLSAAPPAAFGFLDATPGQITVNGSITTPGLAVAAGQTLDLVGGPVTIQNNAQLAAPSGTIGVTSVAGPGEVPVAPANTSGLTVASLGPVSISGGLTDLYVTNLAGKGNAGSIFIRSGALTITGSTLDATNYGGGAGGQISLFGQSQITLDDAEVHAPATAAGRGADINLTTAPGGSIAAADGTVVEVGSASVRRSAPTGGAGQLTVTTGTLTLSSGAIFGSDVEEGSGNTGPISLTANSIVLDGTAPAASAALTGIRSLTEVGAAANAADISVSAGTLTILANGEIVTNTRGAGNAGNVSVAVTGALSIDANSASFSTGVGSIVSPGGGTFGQAGNVAVSAGSLSIVGNTGLAPLVPGSQPFAGLSTQTFGAGSGGALNVNIGVVGLEISNGGVIASTTGSSSVPPPGGPLGEEPAFGPNSVSSGAGGSVNVASLGPVEMSGAGTAITAAALSVSTGDAGSVSLNAPQITLNAGAQIISTTAGFGAGGVVTVTTPGTLSLADAGTQIAASTIGPQSGAGGQVHVQAGSLLVQGGALIASTAAGIGNGGAVTVAVAGDADLSGARTAITAAALAGATGNAGSVSLSAPQITLDAGAQIISTTAGVSTTAGSGAGGTVTVTTPGTLSLADAGTQIAASTTGPQSGAGGQVDVQAGSLLVQGGALIASTAAGRGNGGGVTVAVAGDADLSGGGTAITAQSTGGGDAGSIALSAQNLHMSGGAAISTASATANGGDIRLTVGDLMFLTDSRVTAAVPSGFGNGGNITINPQLLVLQHSDIIAQAQRGNGGDITIVADEFLPSADSLVSASSQFGVSGTVEVIGPRTDLNGSLVVLPSELHQAAEVLRNACAARSAAPRSSLVQGGRGGLPEDPATALPALYLADRDAAPAGRRVTAGAAPVRPPLAAQFISLNLTTRCD